MIETKHWLIEGINEWRQLFGKYNWYTCTLINIKFEVDDWTAGYEFLFVVLGLGIRVRYNTDEALEKFDEWTRDTDLTDLIEHYSDTWTALKDK